MEEGKEEGRKGQEGCKGRKSVREGSIRNG
jgi:hypothetical protein